MIEQELLLLGLLRQSPRHGYEIKIKVREILSLFAGVELKSIYYPLNILKKKGLLTKRSAKQGRRPERFVYCLTDKGRERFDYLLNKSFLDLRRPQFSLDLSLYFLDYLKPASSKRRLQARLAFLNKISHGIEEMLCSKQSNRRAGLNLPYDGLSGGSLALSRILEHNLCLLKAENAFLKNLLNKL